MGLLMRMTRFIQEAPLRFFDKINLFPPQPSLSLGSIAANTISSNSITSNPLIEALWLAAPKSKVTPSRKKIRNNCRDKQLKNIVHFQDCELCGEKKLRHRLCMTCYKKGKYFTS